MTSNDCGAGTKPICELNACRGCGADSECEAKLGAEPGVCLGTEGGRCAGPADVVYAENVPGKCNAGGPGTVASPYCGLAEAMAAAKSGGKAAVVLKGPQGVDRASYAGPGRLTLVGKGGALILPGAGIGLEVTGGDLTARNFTVQGAGQAGLVVRSGSALELAQAQVLDNKGGGILVDGGRLVARSSTVSGNGPGQFGATTIWGGLLLNNPAAGTRLEGVSVVNNKTTGISCSAAVEATGVLATGNPGVDIAAPCNFSSCGAAGPQCGAP
ncbi:MAG: right-handed parallel beta-helix repeat-containing protein [Myxococcales bacterium]|nr:right-handed parallel beta-helix repeat-containing protein [Myxococcales bacterium]